MIFLTLSRSNPNASNNQKVDIMMGISSSYYVYVLINSCVDTKTIRGRETVLMLIKSCVKTESVRDRQLASC